MTFEEAFLYMMIYSFIGWLYESTLYTVTQKKFVNRGFLNGPYCPIYGIGAVLVLVVLGKIENPVLLFLLSALLTCTLEYITSYLMEKLFHARWWDYSNRILNINGRVCALGAVVFGTFSTLLVKVLHPLSEKMLHAIPKTVRHIIAAVLLTGFVIDCIVTLKGFSGTHKVFSEFAETMEQYRLNAAERLHESNVYSAARETFSSLSEKLNFQQRRMINSFPKLKLNHHNDILVEFRNVTEKARNHIHKM